MLDKMTKILFSSFPREVGRKRNFVKTSEEFEQKIDLLNGVDEVFTNANSVDGTIDKIFSDLDGPLSLKQSQKMYAYILEKNVPCIPLASGIKGIHLHSLFNPRKGQDNKIILYKSTKSLIFGTFGTKNNNNELVLNSSDYGSVDPHVIGDLRRLCRVPNTLRPPNNSSYCTFLPPKDFLKMTEKDLMWHIREPHTYPIEDYNFSSGYPNFEDVILPEIDKQQITFQRPAQDKRSKPYVDNDHLQMLLPSCLYRYITVEEPRHHVRVAVTGELLKMGFTDTEIVDMFESLKWVDWDRNFTAYQVSTCKPILYSKKKLKELGICFECGRSCK